MPSYTLSSAEVWQLSKKFFGRYLGLGLIVAIPIFLGLLGVLAQVALTGEPHHSFSFPIWWYPFVIAYGFLTDVLLTFVTSRRCGLETHAPFDAMNTRAGG